MANLEIIRAGPLVTLQDRGRYGMLKHGISASGPMDRGAYERAGVVLGEAGDTAIEFTSAGLSFRVRGNVRAGVAGGLFALKVNGVGRDWPSVFPLADGDEVDITPGPSGNYGYLRFDREVDVPLVLGSRATNVTVGLGGFHGRALRAGDVVQLSEPGRSSGGGDEEGGALEGPIRVIWGLHADLLGAQIREDLAQGVFTVTDKLDRMGVRLGDAGGVFGGMAQLSLVSDAIVPGDIQILGDGTPIVLMRDHQPTGGYPRIATIVSADLDRFAQMRPGMEVRFRPVRLENAR